MLQVGVESASGVSLDATLKQSLVANALPMPWLQDHKLLLIVKGTTAQFHRRSFDYPVPSSEFDIESLDECIGLIAEIAATITSLFLLKPLVEPSTYRFRKPFTQTAIHHDYGVVFKLLRGTNKAHTTFKLRQMLELQKLPRFQSMEIGDMFSFTVGHSENTPSQASESIPIPSSKHSQDLSPHGFVVKFPYVHGNRFALPTCIKNAMEIFSQIDELHDDGFCHSDPRDANIIGLQLIDFEFSTSHRRVKNSSKAEQQLLVKELATLTVYQEFFEDFQIANTTTPPPPSVIEQHLQGLKNGSQLLFVMKFVDFWSIAKVLGYPGRPSEIVTTFYTEQSQSQQPQEPCDFFRNLLIKMGLINSKETQ